MWPRFGKKRILYFLVVFSVLIYFVTHFFNKGHYSSDLEEPVVQRKRPLIWRTLQENLLPEDSVNRTNNLSTECRNSIQGRDFLVDDRGFVCSRLYLLPNGCCDVSADTTTYYSCNTCNLSNNCCEIYEYCVACCLHPSKRSLLELVLSRISGRQAIIYAAVEDQFELCLVKCRTNSHSVKHENKYRNELTKYCYGPTEPHESEREVLNNVAD